MQSQNRASSFLVVLFILLFIIVVAGVIGFFYFSQPEKNADEEGVKFWLYRHALQISGDESTFFVFIKNQEVRDIENAQVMVNFPQGFVLLSSNPECETILTNSCQWSFDNINKGTLKEIEIKGRLFGQADSAQFFTGSLHFQLQGFTSEFSENFSSSVMISPALNLNWNMADNGSLFDPLESTLALENITSEAIDKAQVIVQWPQDFELSNASSKTEKDIEIDVVERILIWKITDLNFYDKKELTIKGSFTGTDSDVFEFKAQAGVMYNDEFFVQTEETGHVNLERFDFVPELNISNRKDSPQIYLWGDMLPVSITYVNNVNEAIDNVTLALLISVDKYIDINHLYGLNWSHYSGPFARPGASAYLTGYFSADIISRGWDKTLIPELENISIGERGSVIFDLPLKQTLDALKNKYSQAQFSIRVVATGTLAKNLRQWKVKSNKITIKINTHIDFNASLRYYDDEGVKIGTGPLPPQQDQKTTYWIFWDLKNTTNTAEDVAVKTRLEQNVVWTDNVYTTNGLVLYNSKTREISWQIDELPLYVGGPYSLVEARFEISVMPETDSVDLSLPLTSDINLYAKDQFTHDTISSTHQFLNTDINNSRN